MANSCIYRHIKPNGETFYIGIGSKYRPTSMKKRNPFWNKVVKKYPNYEVQILKTDLSREEAINLEKILINYYGRRDLGKGTLVNLTDGGDGTVGFTPWNKGKPRTDSTKRKIKESNTGKKLSETRKRNMITSQLKRWSDLDYRRSKCKYLLSLNGGEFLSIPEMSELLGYKEKSTLQAWVQGSKSNKKLDNLNLEIKINNNK